MRNKVEVCQRSSNHKLKAIHNRSPSKLSVSLGVSKIVKSQIESNSQLADGECCLPGRCVKDRQITNWKQFTTHHRIILTISSVCQRSSNHKLKAIHNRGVRQLLISQGVSKIVKSQIESNSQHLVRGQRTSIWCVKDRQITNWKQFTTCRCSCSTWDLVCQRSSNHKLKAIHNRQSSSVPSAWGVSKIVKSQIESNSQPSWVGNNFPSWCVKDRQITNWKQFTTRNAADLLDLLVCQRSSNHKLKAIHNSPFLISKQLSGVSKIVKSQIESNSQQIINLIIKQWRCVKDRQITNWKQFTTTIWNYTTTPMVCQRSSNHKLKAIHNYRAVNTFAVKGVSKIVKSQIESNSQQGCKRAVGSHGCVKDRQITNWKQFTTYCEPQGNPCQVCQRSSNHKLKAIHNIISLSVTSAVRCVKDRQITNWKQFTTWAYHEEVCR